jgi:hypothetical protein
MTNLKLLPCPFCGVVPQIYRVPGDTEGSIACVNGLCFGPKTTAAHIEDASLQWNTRALSPPEPTEGASDAAIALLDRLQRDDQSATAVSNRGLVEQLLAHGFQIVRSMPLQDHAVPVDQWKIVADESVLIYVVHTNAEFEKDEKVRREKWEGWTVGHWVAHNHGGWTYYGMMGKVTHVAPLPAAPAMVAEQETKS